MTVADTILLLPPEGNDDFSGALSASRRREALGRVPRAKSYSCECQRGRCIIKLAKHDGGLSSNAAGEGTTASALCHMTSALRIRLTLLTAASALLLTFVCPAEARQSFRCGPRRIRFERGASSVALRGRLEPCRRRVYKLRARRGQKMSVLLLPEENDLAFWVRGARSAPARDSLVLKGIHRNGATVWSGELPFSGEYEIHVARPPVSDRPEKRVRPYKLEVRVE